MLLIYCTSAIFGVFIMAKIAGNRRACLSSLKSNNHQYRQVTNSKSKLFNHTLKSNTDQLQFFLINLSRSFATLGDYKVVKLLVYVIVSFCICVYVSDLVFGSVVIVFVLLVDLLFLAYFLFWLINRRRQSFEMSFPTIIDTLIGVVSVGENLVNALRYVGDNSDGEVAKQFRLISDRLRIGDDAESVFARSCSELPYKEFAIFTSILKANIERGGQLSDVLYRLSKSLYDSRDIKEKKNALTSEVRASAKIVSAIPVLFVIGLSFISPSNFDFLVSNEAARPILAYAITSEFIGFAIMWFLLRSVK